MKVIKPDVLEKDLIASLKDDGSITHFIGLMNAFAASYMYVNFNYIL
jgi:hypothetical protein